MINLLRHKFYVSVLIFGFALIALGCMDCQDVNDPSCANYDPCGNLVNPMTSYGAGYIYESPGFPDFNSFYPDTTIFFSGDTIPGTCTFFSYTSNVDSFFWKIGDDVRVFRGPKVNLEFGNQFHLKTIEVEHVTFKMDGCFANGYKYDTIKQSHTISNSPFDPINYKYFNSIYRGISTEFPNDSFNIEIKDDIQWISNLPRGTNGNTSFYFRDYDECYFTGQAYETVWLGSIKVDSNKRSRINIKYKISYDLGQTVNWYEFTGKRIN